MDSLRTGSVRRGRGAGWDGERGLRALFVVFVGLFLFVVPAAAQYGGGSGTAEYPYLIYTLEQMNAIGAHESDWDKHFKLMADIDLGGYTGEQFNLIGYYPETGSGTPFTGVFDGDGHTISNFTYSTAAVDMHYIGLFVYTENAVIKNLGLVNPSVYVNATSYRRVGLLVGYLDGSVCSCYVEGGSVTVQNVGGAGLINKTSTDSSITDCHTSRDVACPDNSDSGGVAGLVCQNSSYITNCWSSSAVSGKVGAGLVATNTGIISNSYATGAVNGSSSGGGLVNSHYTCPDWDHPDAVIINCYAAGNVSGHYTVGGLIAKNNGKIVNCYATGIVSGSPSSSGGGPVGKSFYGVSEGGWIYLGSISGCYATGTVSSQDIAGGLVGVNDGADISNSYALGSVYGSLWDRGGLVAINDNHATILKCYSAGFLQYGGLANGVGGLVGQNLSGSSVSASFWDTQTSGLTASAGGTGRTTAQMRNRNTFLGSGWDFVGETANGTDDIWAICNGADYPRLSWQFVLGDFDGDGDVDFADFALMAAK